MKGSAYIYEITCEANGLIYVGSTESPVKRWKIHLVMLKKGNHWNTEMQRDWNLFGADMFSFAIVKTCQATERWDAEDKWLKATQSFVRGIGYNMCSGSRGLSGYKPTKEAREHMSRIMTGRVRSPEHARKLAEANISRAGLPVSEQTRLKLSIAAKGRKWTEEQKARLKGVRVGWKHSDEVREKISIAAKGRTASDETKRKISEAGRGRKWSESQRAKMLLVDRGVRTDEQRARLSASRGGRPFTVTSKAGEAFTFNTLSEARVLGLDPSNIQKCLAGKYLQTKGYVCKYQDSP